MADTCVCVCVNIVFFRCLTIKNMNHSPKSFLFLFIIFFLLIPFLPNDETKMEHLWFIIFYHGYLLLLIILLALLLLLKKIVM